MEELTINQSNSTNKETIEEIVEETIEEKVEEIVEETVIKKQSSKELPPICMYGFKGKRNNCLGFLHRSVKSCVGIVKYDFTGWFLFPNSVEQAKELALKWSDSFERRRDFSDKKVVIYFNLYKNIISVEVKQINNAEVISSEIKENQIKKTSDIKTISKIVGYSKYFKPYTYAENYYPIPYPVYNSYYTPEYAYYPTFPTE